MKFPFREMFQDKPLPSSPTDGSEISRLQGYSMSGRRVLEKLNILACDVVTRGIAGDFVECGVCNGGSAAAIGMALRSTGRRLWLYDSFAGMPPTTALDGAEAGRYVGQCVGSEATVREALNLARLEEEEITIRAGWFNETFSAPLPEAVALLHIDSDWYDSVTLCLETFYDRLQEGGVVILDDFGHWEGCREAFYDFIARRGIKPLVERFGHSQLFWVKERIHNRTFTGHWEIP